MDAVLELVDAEMGFLILKGAGHDEPTIRVARDLERRKIPEPERKISESVSREVLRTGRPILTRNAIGEKRFLASKSIQDLRLRSLICVPLRFRNETLGAIYLDNRHRRDAFRPQDLKMLQAFADQAAVAVTNTRLIEENKRRAAEILEEKQKVESMNIKLRRTVHKRNAQLALAREDLRDRQNQLEVRYRFQNVVGKTQAMQEIFALLEKVSTTTLPVLLEGESGTGKELIARAIHFNSPQKEGRFVSENCGALTESLLESELFGHTRGSFTGAVADKKGLFELADGGTLFLDDVGDMSLGIQQKLLRVLEEGEIRRVGGKENIKVRVRIVSASNKDLRSLVEQGKFREDLYYRLNGIRIRVPSLRERKGDIPLLVERFLERAAEKSGTAPQKFEPDALRALMDYSWPGNVRELRHFVERTLLTAPGPTIRRQDLLFDAPRTPLDGRSERGDDVEAGTAGSPPPASSASQTLRMARDSFEKEFLLHTLRSTRGNVAAAARLTQVSRESFYRLLRKHGIQAAVPRSGAGLDRLPEENGQPGGAGDAVGGEPPAGGAGDGTGG
jgi:Nif-specific regulatory protein